jgi:peptidoglycan hydrolase-like protein with peptidoglycan-binding domain
LGSTIIPAAHKWGGGKGYAPFQRGDRDWPVVALQVNLSGLVTDGDFGPRTEQGVESFQKKYALRVDGVAGIATQTRICQLASSYAEEKYKLPHRLLDGLIQNESGFWLAAYSAHPSDPGFDLGAFQQSFPTPGAQADYLRAFTASSMAPVTAKKIADRYRLYRRNNVKLKVRRAWELAVLYHNWQTAADRLAAGKTIYLNPRMDTAPAQWILIASGGRLSTPQQWVQSYIDRATSLIDWTGVS